MPGQTSFPATQRSEWSIERHLLDQALSYANSLRAQIVSMGGTPGTHAPAPTTPTQAAKKPMTQASKPVSQAQRDALARARAIKAKQQQKAAGAGR